MSTTLTYNYVHNVYLLSKWTIYIWTEADLISSVDFGIFLTIFSFHKSASIAKVSYNVVFFHINQYFVRKNITFRFGWSTKIEIFIITRVLQENVGQLQGDIDPEGVQLRKWWRLRQRRCLSKVWNWLFCVLYKFISIKPTLKINISLYHLYGRVELYIVRYIDW